MAPQFEKKGPLTALFARKEVKKARHTAPFSPPEVKKGPPLGLFVPSFQKITRLFTKFSQTEAFGAHRQHLFTR